VSDAYRDSNPTCVRCGKVITTEQVVTPSWAHFASLCGGPGPNCFEQAEKDIKRIYGQPDVINKRVLDFRVHDWPGFVVGAILATAAALGIFALISTMRADGHVAACYTWPESTGGLLVAPRWNLYGRVEWRSDKLLGSFYSFEEAVAGARTIGCPLDVPAKTPQ
jgi:hypothetical protein